MSYEEGEELVKSLYNTKVETRGLETYNYGNLITKVKELKRVIMIFGLKLLLFI